MTTDLSSEQVKAAVVLFDQMQALCQYHLQEPGEEVSFKATHDGYSLTLTGATKRVILGWPAPESGYNALLKEMSQSDKVISLKFNAVGGEIATTSVDMEGLEAGVSRILTAMFQATPHIVRYEPALGQTTEGWFVAVRPEPTADHFRAQLAVHIEEVSEMFAELAVTNPGETVTLTGPDGAEFQAAVPDPAKLMAELHTLSLALRQKKTSIQVKNLKGLVDSFLDQRVTSIGSLHMLKVPVPEAVAEVDGSNFSKFVDGKPVFDDTGKVIKGEGYYKPSLDQYIAAETFDQLYK